MRQGIEAIRFFKNITDNRYKTCWLVPGARIELAQPQGPRDFKSLASTYSATRALKKDFKFRQTVGSFYLLCRWLSSRDIHRKQ